MRSHVLDRRVRAIRARPVLALLASLLAAAAPAGAAPLAVDARPIPLVADDPAIVQVGALRYLGGLVLSSPDPGFGGLSGLDVLPDGRLLAVGDTGTWVTLRLVHDADGWLIGIGDATMAPILDADGSSVAGSKSRGDAEAVTLIADGGALVAFERDHRLRRYAVPGAGAGAPLALPDGAADAPSNAGLEALTALPDGRLFALTEGHVVEYGLAGWVGAPGAWRSRPYLPRAGFQPTDAAALPDGSILVLERLYIPPGPSLARVRRIAPDALDEGQWIDAPVIAALAPPVQTDNFEGIAVAPGRDGGTRVFIVSDDNFNPGQRTLLYEFAYAPAN